MGLFSRTFNSDQLKDNELQKLDLDKARRDIATINKIAEPADDEDEEPEDEEEMYQRYTIIYKDKTCPNEVYDRVDDTDRDDDFFTLIFTDDNGNICRQHMIAVSEIFRVDIEDIVIPAGRR